MNIYTATMPQLQAEWTRVFDQTVSDQEEAFVQNAQLDEIENEIACFDSRGCAEREQRGLHAMLTGDGWED